MELAEILLLLLIPYAFVGSVVITFSRKMQKSKDYTYNPSVSIFLPTFNEEDNIAKKHDNIMGQTYPIREILVYDCSEDKTQDIDENYSEKFPLIKHIKHPTRIGMARTLNDAFKPAIG